jgi:hypothetical protein
MKRIIMMLTVAAFMVTALTITAAGAFAAQDLPPGCEKDRGTITCTTTDKPGNSDDNGKGKQPEAEVVDETQGNTTNKKPAPQDLADDECTQGSPGLCKQAERQ